jgi:hypothetical protein
MSDENKNLIDQTVLDAYKDYMPTTINAVREAIEYHNEYKATIEKYRKLGEDKRLEELNRK